MYYTDGSTVRKQKPDYQQEEPERRVRKERKLKRRTDPTAARIAERSVSFNARYTLIVSILLVTMIGSCIMMLMMQTRVEKRENDIASKRSELQTIQADNEAVETEIDTMYSQDDIYKIATGRLGMVYAGSSGNDRVLYYDKRSGDYMQSEGQ